MVNSDTEDATSTDSQDDLIYYRLHKSLTLALLILLIVHRPLPLVFPCDALENPLGSLLSACRQTR